MSAPRSFLLLAVILLLSATSCRKDPEMTTPDPVEDELYFPPNNGSGWETLSPESLGWDTSKIPDLLQFLEDGKSRAFLVLKNGRIVIEAYFGKNLLGTADFNSQANWYWASAGKTLTAFTVGLAQEDGYPDIQNSSATYLGTGWADITAEQAEAITVRHHLTMTTGLDDGVNNSDCTDKECLVYLAEPGTRWAYHNAAYTILDRVIEGAAKQDFDDYFHSRLTQKIGMDGFWTYLDYNHVYFSTARSMARFGLLNLNKGKWKEEAIMSDLQYFNNMTHPSQDINESYGYLWWLNGQGSYMLPGIQLELPGSIIPAAPSDL
ncbi:MAG: serine hydrolase domain-containing protein [Saprospiraceae bacterium]|nr:beta-lactamase family protein [Lewinella sp.]